MQEDEGRELSFGRRLTQLANRHPDQTDLVIVDKNGAELPIDWRTLETRANQIARHLEQYGVVADDVVALALPTCLEHVLVTLAIWKLGATLLPLRHDIPDWELDRLVRMAEPRVVVADRHVRDRRTVLRDDLARTTELPDGPLSDRISECINMVASSGSTGQPKIIVVPYRGVIGEDAMSAATLASSQATVLVVSPLYHVNGFQFVAPTMLEGNRVIVMEKFDARQAVGLIERHRITTTIMVPTMLQRIARLDGLSTSQFASISRLVCGGAKVPEGVVDRWLELVDPQAFTIIYGSSERVGTAMLSGTEWPLHRDSVGRSADSVLSVRDAEGSEVPAGVVGEIHFKPLVPRRMFEYVGAPTPAPTDDGFYSIGDLGFLDADGYLHIADRRTDLIITGGANVFPAEVEAALSTHPSVADQVVVGVPDPEWGQRVHAIVQLLDTLAQPTVADLQDHCRALLAVYKVPKTFEFVAVVPRSEAGKLNRTALASERRADAS